MLGSCFGRGAGIETVVLTLIVTTLSVAHARGTTWHGTTWHGTTWHVPRDRATIPDAIAAASDGDVILVAPGAYEGPIEFGGKEILVTSTDGSAVTRITVEAGSIIVARNGESRLTELRGFTLSGGNGTRIGNATYGGAVLIDGASLTLSHCSLRGNRADFGGAVACLNSATPLVTGCVFTANRAQREGGGIYAERPGSEGNRLEIVDCDFAANAAEVGGGVALAGSEGDGARQLGSADIVASRFRWNRASRGAGAHASGMSLVVRDVRFEHNDAEGGGAGIAISGGAFSIEESRFAGNRAGASGAAASCTATEGVVRDSHFVSNAMGLPSSLGRPPQGGGAIALWRCRDVRIDRSRLTRNSVDIAEGDAYGGAIFIRDSTGIVLNDTVMRRNRVTGGRGRGAGGAIAAQSSELTLLSLRAEDNRASSAGGGLFAIEGKVRIESATYRGNTAGTEGGAIASVQSRLTTSSTILFDNRAELSGAGAHLSASPSFWLHVTITRNVTAGPGSGLTLVGGHATVVNSIVRGNAAASSFGGDIHAIDAHLDVRSCILDAASVALGVDNLDVDPRFVSPRLGDLRLRLDSPGVDAAATLEEGGPKFDAEGDARVIDGDRDGEAHADIGADELRPEIAARFGGVGSETPDLAAPLRVNGSAGDRERVVRIETTEPIGIEILAPPSGPAPARFALYAFLEAPDPTTLRAQPFALGLACFPMPLSGIDPANPPIAVWNNAGHRARLGKPTRPSQAAPSSIAFASQGLDTPIRLTLQGILQDDASSAAVPASLTNAVVIDVIEPEPAR